MPPASTRQARLLRWARCDRNPLRRNTERIEVWAVLLVIISYVRLAMATAGYWTRAAGLRTQQYAQPIPITLI